MRTVNRYANTSMVEEYLYSIIYEAVSDHTFAGTLPTTIGSEWRDMVLIDCDTPITDNGVYSWATVYIILFARPNADGTKNVPVLSQLEDKLCDVIESADNPHYSIERVANMSDYNANIGWHTDIVHLNITITK